MTTKTTAGSARSTKTSSPNAAKQQPDRTAHKPLVPFTIDHWRAYASLLVLDNGSRWPVEPFQLEIVDDILTSGPSSEIWLVIGEGNGKTTLMSGVGIYYADYTPSAMVPIAAASRDQAGVLFSQAAGFIRRTPGLTRRFRVLGGSRRIDAKRSGGRIQVFAADDKTGDGIIPGGIAMIDEPHRAGLKLYRTWLGKLDKRGAKLAALSTAGEPDSDFEIARERMIREAIEITVDGCHTRAAGANSVIHDFSVPIGRNVEDLELVKQANPYSGITRETLKRKRNAPTMTLDHWKRFVCNQANRGSESAITPAEWAGRRTTDGIPAGVPVWCGADFGWKWDTTALVPLWMPEPTRRVLGDDFAEILTPPRDGNSLAPEAVQLAFLRIHKRNPIHTVVMDDNAGGAQMAGWIETELGARVVSHSQGHAAMALAYTRWMEALREGWLWHTGTNHEATRQILNAIARTLPGGQRRFDRAARSRGAAQQDRRVWDVLTAGSMVHSVAVGELDVEPLDRSAYRMEFIGS